MRKIRMLSVCSVGEGNQVLGPTINTFFLGRLLAAIRSYLIFVTNRIRMAAHCGLRRSLIGRASLSAPHTRVPATPRLLRGLSLAHCRWLPRLVMVAHSCVRTSFVSLAIDCVVPLQEVPYSTIATALGMDESEVERCPALSCSCCSPVLLTLKQAFAMAIEYSPVT